MTKKRYLFAQRLQARDHTVKLLCLPPTKPPNKTPRFAIPAGSRVHVRKVTSADDWQPHTTRKDLGFERFERYDAAYQHYEFRERMWIIYVHRSKVIHREDLYKAGIVPG